jgi:uncharacterized YigZ family protein
LQRPDDSKRNWDGGVFLKDYLSIAKTIEHEIVINKSRFIGIPYAVSSEEEIPLYLEDARERCPDASHYCYGTVVGISGLVQRFSDDGEPGGTAGMPILQVLLQKELKNILVVVVRYFGGIKLGAGGLVRAYTRAAAEAVNEADIVKMTCSSRGTLSIYYSLLGSVEYFLRQKGIPIQNMNYGENVSIQIITKLDWDGLVNQLMDICSGNLQVERLDSVYYSWE